MSRVSKRQQYVAAAFRTCSKVAVVAGTVVPWYSACQPATQHMQPKLAGKDGMCRDTQLSIRLSVLVVRLPRLCALDCTVHHKYRHVWWSKSWVHTDCQH
jgi:hypothetical protein